MHFDKDGGIEYNLLSKCINKFENDLNSPRYRWHNAEGGGAILFEDSGVTGVLEAKNDGEQEKKNGIKRTTEKIDCYQDAKG